MNLIGDLERLLATSLYPLRVPIAIATILGLVGLALVARRRGWFAAARRHPGRATAVVAVVLAIGLPLGWYLASPLFIRTELIEPAPVAVTGTTPAAPAGGAPSTAATPEPVADGSAAPSATGEATGAPATESTPSAPTTLASGTVRGADEFHFGEGTASIIEIAPGQYTLRFEAFSVRNGPDLYVYLSPHANGYADGAIELGTLKATDGAFGYELPNGTDPADFASAVIWCKQFAVLFAVAPLAAS
ncbi:MAG: DM13 domain-containing protein [Candidatus Limnocylindria bacterium]